MVVAGDRGGFGGNLTAIGASANVVVIGIAMRSGSPISFWEFTKKGAIVTGVTILLAAPYLWLRCCVRWVAPSSGAGVGRRAPANRQATVIMVCREAWSATCVVEPRGFLQMDWSQCAS